MDDIPVGFEGIFGLRGKRIRRQRQEQLGMRQATQAQDFEELQRQEGIGSQQAVPGLLAQLQAGGVDTRQIPGLENALQAGGQGVANQLLQNPQSPLMGGLESMEQQALDQQARELAIAEAQQAAKDQAGQTARVQALAPYRVEGRQIENIRSMKNLLADEGRLLTPSPERGAYNTLRGQLLNAIRLQFDAGALQQAELEFFETLLPDATTFTRTSQGERMAMLNELEYQLSTRLQDKLMFSGEDGLTIDMFAGPGRSIDQLVTGGLPQGFTPGTGEQSTRDPANRAAPEALIQPGMSIF